ncbi:glycosyltransferase [Synechococcus sp. M16CYN]|uniref:glycosyltransferase n=1 Tax=Synechococcus sp. M16CYN TaxID=3103139 RepID=UPI003246BEDC
MKNQLTLLVLAPTRRAASETFIRANLRGLPFQIHAYFGDEHPLMQPLRCLYGLAVFISKVLTQLGWLRFASWPAALVAVLIVRRHHPDVVLAEFGFHAVRVMHVASWSGVPLVVHFRGSDASSESKFHRLKERYRQLMKVASAVIVKSTLMRTTLQALGAPANRVLISPSGADTTCFYGSSPKTAPPIFLAVGRFVPKKGPLLTLAAFECLLNQLPGSLASTCHLIMVGDGPMLNEAKHIVMSKALTCRVHFTGVLPPRKVASLMRQVRGFVQHSLVASDGDSEGSPVAVLEAQLSGLPVVATRHAGIPEVVVHGATGFLVDEGDVQGMANAMARLTYDPQLADKLGAAGRERISSNFTVDHHLAAVSAFLHRVARQGASQQ